MFGFGAGDQHPIIDGERAAEELSDAGQVGDRLAVEPSLDQTPEGSDLGGIDFGLREAQQTGLVVARDVGQEKVGLARRLLVCPEPTARRFEKLSGGQGCPTSSAICCAW